jgi:hypothetical protein
MAAAPDGSKQQKREQIAQQQCAPQHALLRLFAGCLQLHIIHK